MWFSSSLSSPSSLIDNLCQIVRWRSALLWRTFFTTAVVAVVLRGFVEFCRGGKCGLFGEGGLIMFDIHTENSTYGTLDLIAIVLLGVIGGVFGSLYNYLVDKVLRTYSIVNEYVPEFFFSTSIVVKVNFPHFFYTIYSSCYCTASLLPTVYNTLQERSRIETHPCCLHFHIDNLCLIWSSLVLTMFTLPTSLG